MRPTTSLAMQRRRPAPRPDAQVGEAPSAVMEGLELGGGGAPTTAGWSSVPRRVVALLMRRPLALGRRSSPPVRKRPLRVRFGPAQPGATDAARDSVVEAGG